MRALLILLLALAALFVLGRDFWPRSHADPTWHLRFHRGRLPYTAPAPSPAATPVHGRILRPQETNP